MRESIGQTGGVATAQNLFATKVVGRDDESRLAAVLHSSHGARDAGSSARPNKSGDARTRTVVAEMTRAIEARLPGRIRDLKIRVEDDQFILAGVSSSYYVKQVAGHLAMNAMDARLLGRFVNEIEVSSPR